MKISALRANLFPPFGHFEIEFPHVEGDCDQELAEVHVFTGPNGSGKTRLMALIAGCMGSYSELKKRDIGKYMREFQGLAFDGDLPFPLGWQDMASGPLMRREETPSMTFCPRAYLESAEVRANAEIRLPTVDDALSFSRPSDESQRLLQGLFTMDLQAATESRHGTDGRYSRMIQSIERAIQDVTGVPFSFVSTVHPKPELRVRWGAHPETYEITTLPDGLRSILGWLVQGVVWMDIFWDSVPDPLSQPVILLVDEPETHLHPEWQWRVMPMMQRLFPKAQIFAATHSPFIVSSLNENAWIHRLRVTRNGTVTLDEPKPVEKGDSYVTALSTVLEVSDWYDPENRKLLAEFRELRSAALKGGDTEEQEMREKAQEIAGRGMELEQVVGAELRQYERQKQQMAELKRKKA
ncbi:MAG: AAA family ATPase [Verrucomicrobia bacterium]|nr:AAA family ATPase [Verrucomicrobiota bacterium]